MAYPKNEKHEDAQLLKKTKDDEIEELKFKTEKHDHENILKSQN